MTIVGAASEQADKLRELIQDVKFAMLTTRSLDGTLSSRPMTTLETEFDGTLWFLASAGSLQIADIAQRPKINLGYASPDGGRYVSVQGTAEVLHDSTKARELWNPAFKAWFPDGPDSDDVAVVKVEVASADWWETPAGQGERAQAMQRAAQSGDASGFGQHEHVEFSPPSEVQRPRGTC